MYTKEITNNFVNQYYNIYTRFLNANCAALPELQYVNNDYGRVIDSIKKLDELNAQRQRLIELHFRNKTMNLGLHEKYHEVSRQMIDLAAAFFTQSKILLNDVTSVIPHIIPQKELHGIKTGSFGGCINCCAKNKSSNEFVSKLLTLYATDGKLLDDTICFYRDKHIEHNHELLNSELYTSPNEIYLVHTSMEVFSVERPRNTSEDARALFCFIPDILFVKDKRGKSSAYIHIDTSKPLLEKNSDNYLDLFYAKDSTALHFKKYGVHMHFFPSSTSSSTAKSPCEYPNIKMSPEVYQSMGLLADFILKVHIILYSYFSETSGSKSY